MARARAKIVCTIGPATSSDKVIASMIKAGMGVARLNFSHGTHEEHRRYLDTIRKWSLKLQKPVAILQDLQGIKIRIGKVEGGAVNLKKGQSVLLKPGDGITTGQTIFISYPALIKDLKKGQRVLLDDGLILLEVTGKKKDAIVAHVREGGGLTDHKGVNLPDSKISLSSFTDKDQDDLAFGLEVGVDYVALSFVMRANDIRKVKAWLDERGAAIPVIAKIEKPEALQHIDSILDEADGIMVARGDLGVEVPPEEVPIIQKDLIRKANERGRLVITATQMLESMREHMRPTRAEATDVANAVIDGTDALMLSAETATGKYPIESVRMMRRIIEYTEGEVVLIPRGLPMVSFDIETDERPSLAVADAAVRAAADVGAKCIVAFTRSGFTALLVSKCRPSVPVISFAPDETVMRRLSLYWGVRSFQMRRLTHTDEMVFEVEKALINRKVARTGDLIIIIASSPLHDRGKTNFMKIHRIGG
ncbi:MAG TPA: pyruvate kinase [Nitrospirae bacterium]|nr:pyruvate kinase [Nitrospirota bacterium]